MTRRSLIFRGLCALLGLSAARIEADALTWKALTALKPKNLKWTVWLTSGHSFDALASTVHRETYDVCFEDGSIQRQTLLVLRNTDGDVAGITNLDKVRGYGCAYPPVKVEFGYKQEHRSVWAPIQPTA